MAINTSVPLSSRTAKLPSLSSNGVPGLYVWVSVIKKTCSGFMALPVKDTKAVIK